MAKFHEEKGKLIGDFVERKLIYRATESEIKMQHMFDTSILMIH
jgi:hypothetical protein